MVGTNGKLDNADDDDDKALDVLRYWLLKFEAAKFRVLYCSKHSCFYQMK